jgi:general secretion pathway protein N
MMGRIGVFLAVLVGLLVAVIAFLPLRLVLPDGPASVQVAEGTIWRGRLKGVKIGPLALGDLATRFNGSTVNFDDGARLSGVLDPFAEGIGLSALTGEINAGIPLLEPLKLSNVAIAMPASGCVAASGRVTVGLARPIPGIPAGQLLSGSPRCDKGDLLLALASQAGLERVEIRLHPDFSHELALIIKPSDPAMVPLLQLAGFSETSTGYRLNLGAAIK